MNDIIQSIERNIQNVHKTNNICKPKKMQSIERNIYLTELYNITESFYV